MKDIFLATETEIYTETKEEIFVSAKTFCAFRVSVASSY
jgi:hypothetical protein